jgi:hypothetical protein
MHAPAKLALLLALAAPFALTQTTSPGPVPTAPVAATAADASAKAQGRSCFQVFTSDMAGATRNHPGTDVPDQCLVVH